MGLQVRWQDLAELIGEVSEMSVADGDDSIRRLLERTCELIGASDALLSFGLRARDAVADDPLGGWRGTFALRFGPHAAHDAAILDAWYHQAPNLPLDSGIVMLARTTGHARAFRHRELPVASRRQETHVEELLAECGIGDRIIGGRPITDGIELLFGAYRRNGSRGFTEDERELVRALMASIAGFARRLALTYGIFGSNQPLTPRERETLQHLLHGLSEKEVAYELGLAERTLHHYVTTLYRKFGVRSRAELMALFLGTAAGRKSRNVPVTLLAS